MGVSAQPIPPLQTFRLRTPNWAVPALIVGIALHFGLAAWLGHERAATTLGLALVWGLPVLLVLVGAAATGEMARRVGGKLTVDRAHHQLIQRHDGLPGPAGTWAWEDVKDIRVRRRFSSDLVEIDLGSQRLCACTQRCQGHGLVSALRDDAADDESSASPDHA